MTRPFHITGATKAEKRKSQKWALFLLNKRNRGFESISLHQPVFPKPRRKVSVTYGRGAAGCESTDRAGSKTRSVLRWL